MNDRITIAFVHYSGRIKIKTFKPPYNHVDFLGYMGGLAYETVGEVPPAVAEVLSIYDE